LTVSAPAALDTALLDQAVGDLKEHAKAWNQQSVLVSGVLIAVGAVLAFVLIDPERDRAQLAG
jgi:hypothetical protein